MDMKNMMSAYAYNLVVKMYDHQLGYDPYASHTGRLVFRSMNGTSGLPTEFRSWKEVREWLNEIAE